jgi:hypothetical protein
VDALARETIMTTDEAVIPIDRNEHDQKKKSSWRRVGALVGAAAVIVVAIAGVSLLRSESDVVAGPPYANAEDAARAVSKAINLGQWDAYRSAYADEATNDASNGAPMTASGDRAEARFNFWVLQGNSEQIDSCTASNDSSVACRVTRSDVFVEALSGVPLVGDVTYGIEDGLLVYQGPYITQQTPPIVEAFLVWQREAGHPGTDVYFSMYADPVGKDPAVAIAARLEAIEAFLAQYEG